MSPYERGFQAGYCGVPSSNPYPDGSSDYWEWEKGFGDGIDDYILWKESDL